MSSDTSRPTYIATRPTSSSGVQQVVAAAGSSWTPAAGRLHVRRRCQKSKPYIGDEVLGLRQAGCGRAKGLRPVRPAAAKIVRAYKGMRVSATKEVTPLRRQYARLFSKDKGAIAEQPNPAAATAETVRDEERLRCRRAELQELQDLLADRLLSEENYIIEVKRVLEKDTRPETGLSLLVSLAMPLRQAGMRQEELAEAQAQRARREPA